MRQVRRAIKLGVEQVESRSMYDCESVTSGLRVASGSQVGREMRHEWVACRFRVGRKWAPKGARVGCEWVAGRLPVGRESVVSWPLTECE